MTVAAQAYGDELQKVRERLGQTTISDPALTVCLSGLARVEEVLRKPLRIVILGEYNSGKTSVAGLLIGEGLLPTSVVSNTSVPVLMSYAPAPALHGIDRNGTRIRIDSDDDDALTDLSYRALQVALPLDHLRDGHRDLVHGGHPGLDRKRALRLVEPAEAVHAKCRARGHAQGQSANRRRVRAGVRASEAADGGLVPERRAGQRG
jgi:hypothetical protein